MAIEVTHRHHRVLSLAALLPRGAAAQDERLALLRQDAAALEVLAQACPLNFGHRLCLVQAELARVEADDAAAGRLYAQAVEAAHRHGFALHEAQAMERAAAFHLERGDRRLAMALFKEARDGYRQWGAAIKARALEATHPALVAGWGAGPAGLDALAVAKATQALSSRIELEGLIDALMRIALDHAGAQTAWLFLDDGGAVRPAAAATVDGTQVQVQVGPGDAGWPDLLPMAVVQYVRRTREPVLLADAERPHPFLADAYMRHVRPRSVMGLPLLRRGVAVGVLYLEHRLSPHAFTRGRVALLEMLAAQAAISLETARLYAALKQENAERERAQQAATERQSRLQRLVESNLVGVPFADLDGRIVDANEAFLQMVGYHRADLAAGRLNWAEMTPPAHREADRRAAEALRREGRFAPYEKVLRRKDGTEVPVLVGGILFEGEQPQTVGFVLDLTERRRAESERAARVAAEAASEAKSSFLASMSHELRTPLNGVLGYAQLLQMDPGLTPRQRQGLAAIETSGRHLLSLINDILDLARIEAGRLSLVLEPVHLRRVVDTVADTVRPLAERRHLAFHLEAGADLDLTVQADERRLSQVLLNLLGNAVKFTDQGVITLRVQQAASGPSEAGVVFEVQDTGVGMGEDELQRIFRPFEQVGAAHRRVEGTGLGLAITDALVRQMAGTLAVRSRPGDGTVFRVELRLPVLAQVAGDGPPGGVTGYEGPRRTVLVVDDVADSRRFLVDLLHTLGFEPMEACDGPQALAMAGARRPDLILMDNGMPGMTGLEVTQRLRADTRLADVPVITVSAGAAEADRQRCLAAGVSAFVPKPVDVADLLQTIGRVLQLRWTTRDDERPPGPA
jgi:PAS domain S-box-containing protein